MVEIPDSLVERLKSRQVVLVAGLGCNQLAGAPSWSAFTETLAAPQVFSDDRAALAKLIAAGRLSDAVALIRDLVPHPTLEDAITKAYPGGAAVPESVKQAAAFPWRAIVTTGFDDLWERALGEGSSDPPRVMVGTDASAQALSGGPGVPLLHLFGRVAQPRSLCLGPGDARVRLVPSASLAWLDQLRRRRSMVLVGFRPTDPDLVWLSSWLAARPSPGTPHYLFLDVSAEEDPETEALTWALRTGLEILPCLEGTLEAMGRLAKLSASIAAHLPPSDADIDLDLWLDRWTRNPSDPEPQRVLARAEGALRDEERWDRLVELLLRRLDLQEDRRDQIKALAEVARIFRERLRAPERALTAGVAMLRLLPTDDDLWEKLRTDARASGAWQQLVAEATRVAGAAESAAGAGRIWREIARVEGEQLGHPEEALAAYRQALAAEPSRRETRDAQAEILRQLGRWDELVTVLRAAAGEADDPMGALALTLETAELLETNLHDVSGAIAAYEGALAIAPDSEITALALERLCERERRWADLARLLDRRAWRVSADESRVLRRRRAEILIEHLDSLDQAAAELEGLAASDPNDRATLARLEQVYRRARRHDDTLRILQMQADAALGPADRLAILRKLAAEGEALPDGVPRAARAFDEILRLEPRDGEAFPALVRIYRSEGPPVALADILSRRLEVTETQEARRELLLELAGLYERELNEPEKALDAYTAAGKAGDQRDVIHEATARLAERLGRWELSAASLQKWAELAPEAELRAEALLEAALIFSNRLGDSAAAEGALGRALENAPGHPKALAALARLRRDAGDREKAVALFLEAAAAEPQGKEKAVLFTAAATSLQNEGSHEERAVDLLTRAMAADPDHVPAGERLVDIYSARGLWTEALALLDMLVRRLDPDDAERLAALESRRAGACLEIGNMDKALDCLTHAYELRPESLPVLRAFAELRVRRAEWKQAAELSRAILRLGTPALSDAEILEVTLQLGRCQAELREVKGAIATYRDVLALDPTSRKALEALGELHASAGDWSAWARDREALVALAGADERALLWEEIGDVCADKLLDRERAEVAYRKALEAQAGRRSTLHKLLGIYSKDGRWEPAIEVLKEIASVETEPAIKAKTLHAAALIWRDEVGQPGFAAQLFERCLDEAPEMTIAFDELGRLHEETGDWKALARSTQAMLERLDRAELAGRAGKFSGATGRELRLRLWSQLGEVASRHLRDRQLAISAFEAAAALDPGNVRREETLAHLYDVAGPEARDRAVRAHQGLIARSHQRTESYLALAKLYGESGDIDAQWCVAAALIYLQKGGPTVEPFFRQHRPPAVRVARQSFNEELWQRLRHPDEDVLLDELLAVAAPYLMPLAAQTRASLGLGRGSEVDVASDQSGPVRAVAQIAVTLGLPVPDLFRGEGETSETTLVNLQSKTGPRPGLVLGPATLRRSSFDLVFDLTNHMASLRPDRFLKFALRTPATLELGVRVVLAVTGAAEDPYKGQGEAGQLAAYLRKNVPPPVTAQLTAAARKLVEARGKTLDIARWIAGTDLSAARVALALTGDLGAATRVLRSELIPRSPVPIHKRLADLVAFSVSEDYFACRKLLGLQVAAAQPASIQA